MIEKIILTSWDGYIKQQIVDSKPKHLIVIGAGVEKILGTRLNQLDADLGIEKHSVFFQPQGLRTEEAIRKTHKEYQRICSKYANFNLTHQPEIQETSLSAMPEIDGARITHATGDLRQLMGWTHQLRKSTVEVQTIVKALSE